MRAIPAEPEFYFDSIRSAVIYVQLSEIARLNQRQILGFGIAGAQFIN